VLLRLARGVGPGVRAVGVLTLVGVQFLEGLSGSRYPSLSSCGFCLQMEVLVSL
jgi:hypothetical protein